MIYDLLKSAECFLEIKKKEFYSEEKLKDLQFNLLKKTLHFAFTQIHFYRKRMKEFGIHIDDIRHWDDFRKIPILTKSELRSHSSQEFISTRINPDKIWKSQTTGSSGIPITVYRNAESIAWEKAHIFYSFHTIGIKIHHKICKISASLPEKPCLPGPIEKLGFKRQYLVSLKQTDEQILGEIRKIKPHVIFTFPSVFLRLAEYLKSHKIKLDVKILVAQGEVLPESWRTVIQGAFHAPLYHTYGSTEIARIGFECREQNGYHLISDAAVLEVLNEDELIVTNLNNFCMPLIRYQIGDRGTISPLPCSCGIRYPKLENITGRSDDYLILPSGRKVSARAITQMEFDGILQYKVIQRSPSKLDILVIPSVQFGEKTVKEIHHVLTGAFLGEEIKIEIKPTESLPVSRTGKLQLVSREF